MQYKVKALTAGQSVEELLIDARDDEDLRRVADARGLTVLSLRRMGNPLAVAGGGRSGFPLQLFSQELLALLQSGLPLVEAIQTLAEKETRATVRDSFTQMLRGLQEGRNFSAVLSEQPGNFPDLYIAMIRAAERTSDLDQALARFIAYRTQVDVLRGKLIGAAIYPVMLLAVGALVVLFLLGYVVPRFAGVFEDSGSELPFASRLMLDWGQWMSGNAIEALIGFAVLIAALVYLLRDPGVRAWLERSAWRIPGLGDRLKVFQLARFFRTLSMLVSGGMTVLTAMGMSRDLLSAALRSGLDAATQQVREGKALSDALAHNGLTTPVAGRLLRVGERAGNLGEMCERIAVFHEEEIGRWVEWITRLIGPVLMLVIGLVIGGIVVLMYLPIFQLAESIQ